MDNNKHKESDTALLFKKKKTNTGLRKAYVHDYSKHSSRNSTSFVFVVN